MKKNNLKKYIEVRLEEIHEMSTLDRGKVADILNNCFQKFKTIPKEDFLDEHDYKNYTQAKDTMSEHIENSISRLINDEPITTEDGYFDVSGTLAMLLVYLK